MKSAFVAIIGRPSSGKSTLLNQLCGHKVSIVSPHPQTTRNKVRGIVNKEPGQLVFLDTPGFHKSEKKFNLKMMEKVREALNEADLVLYLLDGTTTPGEEEAQLAELVSPLQSKLIIALNKTDSPRYNEKNLALWISEQLKPEEIISISALEGTDCSRLLEKLYEKAPEGEAYYPEEYYTDQDPQFRISEIIREEAINRLSQELPHALFVRVEDIETEEESQKLWIRALILVEKESQKGIVVGKQGLKIRDIRQNSQKQIAKLFPYRIYLDLRVKVMEKWRKRDVLIQKIIG